MVWLEASDCILLLSNWWRSSGAIKEMDRAKELGIPIYYSIDEIKEN